ncbi:hypothetical protein SH501x_003204 [Pirellulaceae bacterium SH501]
MFWFWFFVVLFFLVVLSWPIGLWSWYRLSQPALSASPRITEDLKALLSIEKSRRKCVAACLLAPVWLLAVALIGHITLWHDVSLRAQKLFRDSVANTGGVCDAFANAFYAHDYKNTNATSNDAEQNANQVKKRLEIAISHLHQQPVNFVRPTDCVRPEGWTGSVDGELQILNNNPWNIPARRLTGIEFDQMASNSQLSSDELNRLTNRLTFIFALTDPNDKDSLPHPLTEANSRLTRAEWYFSQNLLSESARALVCGYQSPLRDSIATRLLYLSDWSDTKNSNETLQKKKVSRLLQLIIDGRSLAPVTQRTDLASDEGKAILDAIADQLEPTGFWSQVVSVTMSVLLGIFQLATFMFFSLAIAKLIDIRNTLAVESTLVIKDTSPNPNEQVLMRAANNVDHAAANEAVQKLTFHEFVSTMPKFSHEFWENQAFDVFATWISSSANSKANRDFLVPKILSYLLGQLRGSTAQLRTSDLANAGFIERSIDAIDRKCVEHEKELDTQISAYIAIVETIGFIGTLLGIVIAFGAIPAMQLPTNDPLRKAQAMAVVTIGLVLAFSTTLVAQSIKLILILGHKKRHESLAHLNSELVKFTEEFVSRRRS